MISNLRSYDNNTCIDDIDYNVVYKSKMSNGAGNMSKQVKEEIEIITREKKKNKKDCKGIS